MRIVEKSLSAGAPPYPLNKIGPEGRLMLLDIGTSGTVSGNGRILIIGTAVPSSSGSLEITQYLAESSDEEPAIILAFLETIASFHPARLITFNGERFDLRFIRKRAALLGIDCRALDGVPSGDLYRIARPYRDASGLPDLREETLIKALTGTDSGRGIPSGIFEPSDTFRPFSPDSFSLLASANEQSLVSLVHLTPIFSLEDLVLTEPEITRAQADTYHDHEGRRTEEILLYLSLSSPVPFPVAAGRDSCFFKAEGSSALVKAPVLTGEMKYFYADYRNYDYFPAEDQALHRSIAMFADKTHRIPCTRENCYTRKSGAFIPFWGDTELPVFRRTLTDPTGYIEFSDRIKGSRKELTSYALSVLRHIADPEGKYFALC